jgi:hypothetical protein
MAGQEAFDMSRFVEAEPSVELTGGTQRTSHYLERVAKYIPGEIIATYMFVLGIIKTVDPAKEQLLPYVAWAALGCCFVLTPIYFYMFAPAGKPKWHQIVISSSAFVIWAYALGGPFELAKLYKPWLSSIILALFTAISGLFKPARSTRCSVSAGRPRKSPA